MDQPRTIVKGHIRRAGGTTNVGRRIASSIAYLDETKDTEDGRRLFTADNDTITREDAAALIMDAATDDYAMNRLILSPGADQQPPDMERWTRDMMAYVEGIAQGTIRWVAAVHRDTPHHHAHVVLGASMIDANGERTTLPITWDKKQDMRIEGDRLAREQTRQREVKERARRDFGSPWRGRDDRDAGRIKADASRDGARGGGRQQDGMSGLAKGLAASFAHASFRPADRSHEHERTDDGRERERIR